MRSSHHEHERHAPVARSVGARWILRVTALAITIGLLGCATSPPRAGVPAESIDTAIIPGLPDARFWGDESPEWSNEFFAQISDEELKEQFSGVYARPHHYLAISVGGRTVPTQRASSPVGRRTAPGRNLRW